MAVRSPVRGRLARPAVGLLAVLVAVEAFALVGYLAFTGATVEQPRYLLYPFLWIDAALLGVLLVSVPDAPSRTRLLAAGAAAGYFLVLSLLAGLVSVELGHGGHSHAYLSGLQVTMAAPGWGPRVGYAGDHLSVNLVPYRVVGYLGLAYLAYAATLETVRSALPGAVGLASCLGCSLPLLVGTGLGGATGLLASLSTFSVDLSTLAFLAAVAVLVVRPGTPTGPFGTLDGN